MPLTCLLICCHCQDACFVVFVHIVYLLFVFKYVVTINCIIVSNSILPYLYMDLYVPTHFQFHSFSININVVTVSHWSHNEICLFIHWLYVIPRLALLLQLSSDEVVTTKVPPFLFVGLLSSFDVCIGMFVYLFGYVDIRKPSQVSIAFGF